MNPDDKSLACSKRSHDPRDGASSRFPRTALVFGPTRTAVATATRTAVAVAVVLTHSDRISDDYKHHC